MKDSSLARSPALTGGVKKVGALRFLLTAAAAGLNSAFSSSCSLRAISSSAITLPANIPAQQVGYHQKDNIHSHLPFNTSVIDS